MCKEESLSSVGKVARWMVLSGCLMGMMIGCSNKLQTAVTSKTEPPPAPQEAEAQSVAPEAESPVSASVQTETFDGIPPFDIPVEEPARPSRRPSSPAEELGTPPIEVSEPTEAASLSSVPAEELPAPPTKVAELDQGEKAAGIPPIDIPVEEPARPTIRPSAPAEDLAAVPPMEVAEPLEESEASKITPQGKVEELPASPSAEIFATPRADALEPADPSTLETPTGGEGKFPSSPAMAPAPEELSSQESSAALGIPPVAFEPEMPALPTLREEAASPEEQLAQRESESTQESVSVPPKKEEPVQIAKAVPEAPVDMEGRMEDSLKDLQDVYFDYDRFTIGQDALSILQENAQALVNGLSDRQIVIEGHCDERGTESYNMVLGKRRASAVKKVLIDLGVPGDQLQVVSYGKEKPFCIAPNEACWQENRRGHFVLK